MRILDNIALEKNIEEFKRFSHLERFKLNTEDFNNIIDEGYQLIDPKAIYIAVKVSEINADRAVLENGCFFISDFLAERLRCKPTLAPYVATIGPALEKKTIELGSKHLMKSFILDSLGTFALHQIYDILENDFRPDSKHKLSKFSPGVTPHWDIAQQKIIFDIFGVEKIRNVTGIQLNDNNIMIPKKSISGIIVDVEKQFHECQFCKIKCDHRKYTLQKWRAPL